MADQSGRLGLAVPWLRRVVIAADHVVQAQGHGVVQESLPRTHHDIDNGFDDRGIGGPGHARPFFGDGLRGEVGIPREAAQDIPVGLREMMAGPVHIEARVQDAGDARHAVVMHFAFEDFGDSGTLALGVGVGLQEFFPHGAQVNEMFGLAEVFLRGLEFGHDAGLLERAEEWGERLTCGWKSSGPFLIWISTLGRNLPSRAMNSM